METKKQLRSKLEKATSERNDAVELRRNIEEVASKNRQTHIGIERSFRADIDRLHSELNQANDLNAENEATIAEMRESQTNAIRHHQDERLRRIGAEKEADMLRGVVDYFIARHRLDYSETVEDDEVVTDYQRLAEDVAVSGLQPQVTQARKNLGFKG